MRFLLSLLLLVTVVVLPACANPPRLWVQDEVAIFEIRPASENGHVGTWVRLNDRPAPFVEIPPRFFDRDCEMQARHDGLFVYSWGKDHYTPNQYFQPRPMQIERYIHYDRIVTILVLGLGGVWALRTHRRNVRARLRLAQEMDDIGQEMNDLGQTVDDLGQTVHDLKATNSELESTQIQRTQTSKQAAVGQLAAGVAHELNTPLGAIIFGIDSALPKLDTRPELVSKKLELARASAVQAQAIVEKLLYYGRDATVGRKKLDLSAVVKDTVALVAAQWTQEGLRLEMGRSDGSVGDGGMVVVGGEEIVVDGNQAELQQIVLNLLANAREAVVAPSAPGRSARVRVWADDRFAMVDVIDEGPGVSSDIEARIFEPFFTTRPVGKGTGLGLSVALQLAAQHEGTLELLDSSSGRTTFRLRLPRVQIVEPT